MARQIAPGTADYESSRQMFRIMKIAQRRMNDSKISGTKRKKARNKFSEYRNALHGRDYCTMTEPKPK